MRCRILGSGDGDVLRQALTARAAHARVHQDDLNTANAVEEETALTERAWKRLENTMHFIVEQQAQFEAKFEANFGRADQRFAQPELRLDRLERLADRVIRAGERRMVKAEAEIAELRASLKSFLQAMRRSGGNGRGKS
jgi:hypothetical protein